MCAIELASGAPHVRHLNLVLDLLNPAACDQDHKPHQSAQFRGVLGFRPPLQGLSMGRTPADEDNTCNAALL